MRHANAPPTAHSGNCRRQQPQQLPVSMRPDAGGVGGSRCQSGLGLQGPNRFERGSPGRFCVANAQARVCRLAPQPVCVDCRHVGARPPPRSRARPCQSASTSRGSPPWPALAAAATARATRAGVRNQSILLAANEARGSWDIHPQACPPRAPGLSDPQAMRRAPGSATWQPARRCSSAMMEGLR